MLETDVNGFNQWRAVCSLNVTYTGDERVCVCVCLQVQLTTDHHD